LRGAGLIGAAAAYGMYLGVLEANKATDFNASVLLASDKLKATRPTAVNLKWAVDLMLQSILTFASEKANSRAKKTLHLAESIANKDATACKMIGEHGLVLLRELSKKKNGKTLNILTHCNAGWLAFVDFGSATAPIYAAFAEGIDIHIWVDETRPRNQGARLTAWELKQHGIKHTIIPDNTGGYLMQKGLVDMVIVGSDRTTRTGDVINKIGTYLKALAAQDNAIPFYVAIPSSSLDWETKNAFNDVSIEERNVQEISKIEGLLDGNLVEVELVSEEQCGSNYGFDITPARLVSGLITERGICNANEESILNLFPEYE
jgi:methylthioribose-1-phosphate isomerase